MKIQFNEAQLSRPQRESLMEILNVLEAENKNEIEVSAFEFPEKLSVKVDKGVMILVWDAEKKSYSGLAEPELEPAESNHGTLEVDLPGGTAEPEPDKLGVGAMMESSEPEPDLDLFPIIERSEALARALVKLSMPLNTEQRMEVWMKFCIVLAKELWK